jgi:hypothetical protein
MKSSLCISQYWLIYYIKSEGKQYKRIHEFYVKYRTRDPDKRAYQLLEQWQNMNPHVVCIVFLKVISDHGNALRHTLYNEPLIFSTLFSKKHTRSH